MAIVGLPFSLEFTPQAQHMHKAVAGKQRPGGRTLGRDAAAYKQSATQALRGPEDEQEGISIKRTSLQEISTSALRAWRRQLIFTHSRRFFVPSGRRLGPIGIREFTRFEPVVHLARRDAVAKLVSELGGTEPRRKYCLRRPADGRHGGLFLLAKRELHVAN